MKVLALFDVDEETLVEVEGGCVSNALAWCSDSGMSLETYVEVNDNLGYEDFFRMIPDAMVADSCKKAVGDAV